MRWSRFFDVEPVGWGEGGRGGPTIHLHASALRHPAVQAYLSRRGCWGVLGSARECWAVLGRAGECGEGWGGLGVLGSAGKKCGLKVARGALRWLSGSPP